MHFYESIDQHLFIEKLYTHIENKNLRRYLYQIIHRTIEYGGNYREITRGISRGSPLSPIFGALYLHTLDQIFEQFNDYYIRHMDDILILTKTRWQNRCAIKQMNACLNQLKVKQHPDKTFIESIEKGFDFLGYHFARASLHVAYITVKKHVERINQLYEQQKTQKATSKEMVSWVCTLNGGDVGVFQGYTITYETAKLPPAPPQKCPSTRITKASTSTLTTSEAQQTR